MSSNSYITLIQCTLATVDSQDNCYPDGMVIIHDNKIEFAGPAGQAKAKGRIIDMKNKIVMPGLINTHTHSPSSLFRGFGDDRFLMDWLKNYMWPLEKNLDNELVYYGSCLSYLEYLEHGMTTNVDMWYFADSLANAAQSIGLRSFIASGIFTWPSPQSDNSLRDAEDFVSKYSGHENKTLVYPCYGPHDAYSCTPDILKVIAALAKKTDTMIHTHLSETQENNQEIMMKYHQTPAEYMEDAGIFDNHLLAAHAIHLSIEDMERFKRANAYVSYNPVSNLKLCDGILPMKQLRKYGIGISIGVDGAQSNNSLDLLSDIKTGTLIQKMWNNDPTFFPAREAVRMITIDGARALHMEDFLGSLEPGKLADIISLDTADANLAPGIENYKEQIYSHIIYSACGMNVSDVFVNGKQLMSCKIPLHCKRETVIKQANKTTEYLYKKWKQT